MWCFNDRPVRPDKLKTGQKIENRAKTKPRYEWESDGAYTTAQIHGKPAWDVDELLAFLDNRLEINHSQVLDQFGLARQKWKEGIDEASGYNGDKSDTI